MKDSTRTIIDSELHTLNQIKLRQAQRDQVQQDNGARPWYRAIGIIAVALLGTLTISETYYTVEEYRTLQTRAVELEQENARLARIVNRRGIDLYAPVSDVLEYQTDNSGPAWSGYRVSDETTSRGI
ncbi:MAG: hypothetical protein SV201_04915 [Pseudomonadota bacterium]|nr:hypothetical protein [Pseudomonadota bacterium]